MENSKIDGIYVIEARIGSKVEYWAAATPEARAVAAVQAMLPSGWQAAMTDRQLSPEQIESLRLTGNCVEKLKFGL
jgi:hypothetical protein